MKYLAYGSRIEYKTPKLKQNYSRSRRSSEADNYIHLYFILSSSCTEGTLISQYFIQLILFYPATHKFISNIKISNKSEFVNQLKHKNIKLR